ncbi:MAG: DNA replication complex GINS family protein, partial [Candidatus Bathyarchaeota archaeon]
MYDKLYEAWTKERETTEIQTLLKDFYVKLADYIKKLKEESRMLDEKTVRAKLLQRESDNVKKMVKELIELRYEKALKKTMDGDVVAKDTITGEEEELLGEVSPSIDSYQTLLKDILGGRSPRIEVKEKPKTMILRFIQEIPAIVGADMKTYGPFKPEDIGSLPT